MARKRLALALLSSIILATPSGASNMELEELLNKLEAASPWNVAKVSQVIGEELTLESPGEPYSTYLTGGISFGGGLEVERIHFRVKSDTNQTFRLIVYLSDEAGCFDRARIKQSYPDLKFDPRSTPRGRSLDEQSYYLSSRPWGSLFFGFKERRPDCLSSIVFVPQGQ